MGITAAALPIVWVAVGGRGDLTATLLGTIGLIGGFQALTVYGSQYALMMMGLLLVLTVLFAPEGLIPAIRGRAAPVPAPLRRGARATALLETRALNKRFGGLHDDVNLALEPGELHCLIGPNGAGKSTLFRLILGEYAPTSGHVLYDGADITALEAHDRIRRGISVKFQVPGVFKALSVSQNLEVALQHHLEGHSLRGEIRRQLDFLNLTPDAAQRAGNLSHGHKQWLEIGMATSLKPKLLMLEEPTAGMSPDETRATGETVRALNAEGVTVLAVEHDMEFVRQVASRVTVLHFGRVFAQGSIEQIMADDRVAESYLGRGHGAEHG